jgi:glutamate synthase domain-containing protein 1
LTVMTTAPERRFDDLEKALVGAFGSRATLARCANHAVLKIPVPEGDAIAWLQREHPDIYVTASGRAIEIYKAIGRPAEVISRFGLDAMAGSHALGHTRMATESAVTTRASHPFSTGHDVCLMHNGSLSNHNRLRETLRRRGIHISTDNDSEVAAGYLQWRMSEGDTLEDALNHALEDLDGFYTFAIGTADGFAVLRDPIGCKPAVMAETGDWVAMASEFRAISVLPGVKDARIEEPEPGKIYTWLREADDA